MQVAQVPFSLLVRPGEECLSTSLTTTPANIVIGAMVFAVVMIATGVVYDTLSRSFLRGVLREYLRSHEARVKAEAASAEAKHRCASYSCFTFLLPCGLATEPHRSLRRFTRRNPDLAPYSRRELTTLPGSFGLSATRSGLR